MSDPSIILSGRWAIRGDEHHGYVVEDLAEGVEVGQAGASCTPLLVTIDGEEHIIFAGTVDSKEQRYTAVDGHEFPVRRGVWMSFPEPFTPGRVVEVVGLDANHRQLFRLTSQPLTADQLMPLAGPSWTKYAPLA